MGDVMTLFGASDQQFTSVVTQMIGTARRLKSSIESSPIRVPIEAAGPAVATRSFAQGIRVFGNGVRGGSEGPGMGSSLMGGLGAMGTMAGGLAGATGAAAMLVVGVNRVLGRVSEAGREQQKWTAEVMKTSNAYVQLATAALKPMDAIAKAKADALADAKKANEEAAAQANAGQGNDKNAFSRGFDRLMVDLSAWGKIGQNAPLVSALFQGYDFGDGRFYSEKQDEKARISEGVMNRNALKGNEVANAKELEASKAKFIAEGKMWSQSAEAMQRDAEARAKEIAGREKAKQLATEDLRVGEMLNRAQMERLGGREKEASLLEANAAYLQKVLELERDINLTNEQKSRMQMQAWGIYGAEQREINKKYIPGGVGLDASVLGGAVAAASRTTGSDKVGELINLAKEQREYLKTIAKHAGSGATARFGK
jgi:hypothetical protein